MISDGLTSDGNEENIFTYNKDPIGRALQQHQASTEPYSIEQPFKVLNFGFSYVQTSNLAIWLIKWAAKFQKIMMNHKSAASFWYTQNNDENATTLKLTSINSNFLVSCVFMANNNNLEHSALYLKQQNQEVTQAMTPQPMRRAETIEDDFTQISNSISMTSRRNLTKVSKLQQDEQSSLSTTLDISSFTENQVKHFTSNLSSKRRKSSSISAHNRSNSFVNQKQDIDYYGNVTSRTDVTVDSTIDASDYYNLRDLKVNQSILSSARKETVIESLRDSFRDSSLGFISSARADIENKSILLGELNFLI